MSFAEQEKIAFVAIGRNEGKRLHRCIDSLTRCGSRIVYVDSGSQDESVAEAASRGATVVELSSDKPFTAARARNKGFAKVNECWPDTQFVMFIDGDCELIDGFAQSAVAQLLNDKALGIVTGRCLERFPDATIYNRLCDMEWIGPEGDIDACGGIFVTRSEIFESAGGFNSSLIAGEEPEFCHRVRGLGFSIRRIADDMCFHDAHMEHFGQWWRRSIRAGTSFAQVAQIHPNAYAKERRRAWLWAAVIPGIMVASIPFSGGLSVLLSGLYGVSFWKTRRDLMRGGASRKHASLYAMFLVIAKFPNLAGMLNYYIKSALKRPVEIIEYK